MDSGSRLARLAHWLASWLAHLHAPSTDTDLASRLCNSMLTGSGGSWSSRADAVLPQRSARGSVTLHSIQMWGDTPPDHFTRAHTSRPKGRTWHSKGWGKAAQEQNIRSHLFLTDARAAQGPLLADRKQHRRHGHGHGHGRSVHRVGAEQNRRYRDHGALETEIAKITRSRDQDHRSEAEPTTAHESLDFWRISGTSASAAVGLGGALITCDRSVSQSPLRQGRAVCGRGSTGMVSQQRACSSISAKGSSVGYWGTVRCMLDESLSLLSISGMWHCACGIAVSQPPASEEADWYVRSRAADWPNAPHHRA